jgi:hypothetical protein
VVEVRQAIRKYGLWALAALYFIGVSVYILQNADQLQWDFKTYYYAGVAYSQGMDPYPLSSLSSVAGQEIGFPFAYPPYTLPIFRIFSMWFEYDTAYAINLGLKILALALLVRLWHREFLSSEHKHWFPIVLVLGFSGAVYLDLISGNISIYEQLGIWAAFAALKHGKVLSFSILIAVVACFKITPILFLASPFLLNKRWKEPVLVFSGWLLLQVVSYTLQPVYFGNFLQLASKLDERMPHNPSTLAVIRDLIEGLQQRGIMVPDWISMVLFGVIVLLVGWLTWKRVRQTGVDWNLRLYLMCLGYALILPRFKNYSFVLLLVPALVFLVRLIKEGQPLGMLLVILSVSFPIPFGLSPSSSNLFWGYYPILLTALIWYFALQSLGSHVAEAEPLPTV